MRFLALILVLAYSAVNAFQTGRFNLKITSRSTNLYEGASSEEDGAAVKQIKLPIVQIITKGVLEKEYICGNDMKTNIIALKQTLHAMKDVSPSDSSGFIENMYTESMLTDSITGNDSNLILKIYRDGCKKCAKLEPLFVTFPEEYKIKGYRWLQVKSSDIPEYIEDLKARIQASSDP